MGAAVAQAECRRRVQQHLAHGLEAAVGVVEHRAVEELAPAVDEHQLQQRVPHVGALGGGDRRHRTVGTGLVVGRVPENVDVPRVHEAGDDRVVGQLGQLAHKTGPQLGVGVDAGHLLGPGQEADAGLAPRGGEVERVERREAQQDRHRAPVHLRTKGHTFRGRLGGQVELAAPRLGVVVVLSEGEGDWAVGRGRQATHPRHLFLRRGQVLAEGAGRRQLEHAGPELAEHRADAEELVLGRERAGHGLTVDGPVGQRA